MAVQTDVPHWHVLSRPVRAAPAVLEHAASVHVLEADVQTSFAWHMLVPHVHGVRVAAALPLVVLHVPVVGAAVVESHSSTRSMMMKRPSEYGSTHGQSTSFFFVLGSQSVHQRQPATFVQPLPSLGLHDESSNANPVPVS